MGARKGEKGQRPWYEDQATKDVVDQVARLKSEGHTYHQIAALLSIGVTTAYEHFQRHLESYRAKHAGEVEDYIADMDSFIRRCYAELDTADGRSLNRGAILGHIRAAQMDKAKLAGMLKDKVEHSGEVTNLLDFVKRVAE